MKKTDPGIYMISNIVTGDCYVGSSNNMSQRWSVHRCHLRKNKGSAPILQAAWNKYGEDAFVFEILEVVHDLSQLIEREQYYIDTFLPRYNIRAFASKTIGHHHSEEAKARIREIVLSRPPVSDETKRRLRQSHKGILPSEETLERRSKSLRGKKRTPEQRANLRNALLSSEAHKQAGEKRRGQPRSPETRAKIKAALNRPETKQRLSAAHKGRPRPPVTEEWREKLRLSHLGKTQSPEMRAKNSASNKGKKISPETIVKRKATRQANLLAKSEGLKEDKASVI